jgi:hypothetical protein
VAIIASIVTMVDHFIVADQSPIVMAVIVAIIEAGVVIPVLMSITIAFFIALRVFRSAAMGRRPGWRIGHYGKSRKKKCGDYRNRKYASHLSLQGPMAPVTKAYRREIR